MGAVRSRGYGSVRRRRSRFQGVAGAVVVAAVVGAGSVLFGGRVLRMIEGIGEYVAGLFGAA